MVRSVLLRGLAIVYFIAFASLLPQVNGLVGSNGILPVSDYLETIDSEYGTSGQVLFPTLAWFNSSDTFLHVLIWGGIVLAIALFAGILPLAAAIGLFILFLSFDTAGPGFLSRLCEATLLVGCVSALSL